MAYQTGTAASPAALQTIIETFALANGYTGTAGGILTSSTASDSCVRFSTDINLRQPLVAAHYTSSGTAYSLQCSYSVSLSITAGQVITISGCSPSNFNGTFTVTSVSGAFVYFTGSSYTGTATTSSASFFLGSVNTLSIEGFTSSAGANPVYQPRYIYIPTANWPVTYYLFANTSPTVICCAILFNVSYVEHFSFGSFVPISSSAFVGSSWFHAPYVANTGGFYAHDYFTSSSIQLDISSYGFTSLANGGGNSSSALIAGNSLSYGSDSYIHAEIDSTIWLNTNSSNCLSMTDSSIYQLSATPNAFNSQASLVPIHIQALTSLSTPNWIYLGYIEHIRYIRIDNYNIGDIITLGSDQWMIFPVFKKDVVNRNGATWGASGTVGYAIRKT